MSSSRKQIATVVSTVTIAMLMSVGITAPAHAQPDAALGPDAAVNAAAAVAPDQGTIRAPERTLGDAALEVSVASASVTLPVSVSGSVEVSPDGLAAVSIPLPAVPAASDVAVGRDGSAVYGATGVSGVTVLAQVMEDEAVRIQTVSHGPESQTVFSYDFESGSTPMIDEDGNVIVVDVDDPENATVLTLDEPWAFDATGAPVPTWYEVHDASLVQHIAPSADAQYPIVADPRWEWQHWGYGMALNKRETRDLASSGAATGGCVVFGPAAPACAVLGAQIFTQANIAKNNNQCIFLQVAPAPMAWRYSGGYCR